MIADVENGIEQALGTSPQASAIRDAVVSFIKRPQSLLVSVKSAKGFGLANLPLLQDPPALLEQLEVTATANQ